MLRKSEGFFLLELLLSLSAWLMLCLYFIPLLIDLSNQSWQLEIENKARQLMFEELQGKLLDGATFTNYSVVNNGILYEINWADSSLDIQKEVCVRVEKNSNSFLLDTEQCGVLE